MKSLKQLISLLFIAALVAGCGSSSNDSALEELNLNTGSDPIPSKVQLEPSSKMRKGDSSQLLDNLKAQHFQSKIRIVDLPDNDDFNDTKTLFQEKELSEIDKPFAQIVSLVEVTNSNSVTSTAGAPTVSEVLLVEDTANKKSKENTIDFEISGSFDYLWPTSYDNNTLKFSSINYLAGSFFEGVGRDQLPALFLRFKEGQSVTKVLADNDEQVFHIYDDKRTIGLLRSRQVKKIEIQITSDSTGAIETITLDLTAERYYNAGYDLRAVEEGADLSFTDSVTSGSAASPASDNESAESTSADGSGASQTNTQVAGVDEADIVKTNGDFIFAIKQNTLIVYDVSEGTTSTAASYDLESFSGRGGNTTEPVKPEGDVIEPAISIVGGDSVYYGNAQWQIYLHGDSTIVLHGKISNSTNITILSFDGAALTLEKSFLFDDTTISTRKIDNKLLLFTQNYLYPKNNVDVPYHFAFTTAQQSKLQSQNDAVLATLALEDFGVNLNVSIKGSDGLEVTSSFLNEKDIFFNENSGGRSLVKTIQIDLENDHAISASGTLVDGAENLYVTKDALYIWNTSWASSVDWWVTSWASSEKTNIYRFAIEDDGIRFHSHAQTSGHIINRFAVSEYDDHFRVATYSWADGASALKVLAIKESAMEEVGVVDNIAPGERLQSTRFVGDKAYLVTFLRTDPLFTLDLSDPKNPEIKGELKITGFSEYLHPIDDGTLLGLGHDATLEGRTKGVQLSSFDVSDMTNPTEVDKVIFGESGNSIATSSPHAFTWYPTLRLVAFPLKIYDTNFSGLAVYRLTPGNTLEEVAILKDNSLAQSHGDIRRAIFIGSKLYYLNNGEIITELDIE